MEGPCLRCGSVKTKSVRHGFIYRTAWTMGYHLRRCSYCNRWRLTRRGSRDRPHPDEMTMEELQESFNRRIAAACGNPSAAMRRPGGIVTSYSAGQSRAPGGEPSTSSLAEAEATREVEHRRRCPKCGSSSYRRSRRRWYERLVRRPRMARCLYCNHRFPYPR